MRHFQNQYVNFKKFHIKVLILFEQQDLQGEVCSLIPLYSILRWKTQKETELCKALSILFLFIIFHFKHIEHWFLKTEYSIILVFQMLTHYL